MSFSTPVDSLEFKRISPAEMGINAMAGNESSNEGNWIDARGYNQVTLFVKFVASGHANDDIYVSAVLGKL